MANEELTSFRVYIAEYKTKLTRKYQNRKKWVPRNKNHLLAQIPGTILEVHVKEKQGKKKGDVVLVLEAMKMANRILMPFDGTIKAIHVKKGDIVPKNQLMVEIEPLR